MTTNAVGEKGPEILTGASPPSFGQYPKENPLFPRENFPNNLFSKYFGQRSHLWLSSVKALLETEPWAANRAHSWSSMHILKIKKIKDPLKITFLKENTF